MKIDLMDDFRDYEVEALYQASRAGGDYLENGGFQNFSDMTQEEWINFLVVIINKYITLAVPF